MAVVVVGMHERDVPLEIFERVAVSDIELSKALSEIVGSPNVSEAAILSTCLRTEVYAVVDRFHDGVADIEGFLRLRAGDGHERRAHDPARAPESDGGERRPEAGGGVLDLGGGLVCRYDDAAIAYLFEVAAGIDSPVLGEGEILRQVRDAADAAREQHVLGAVLDPLFRHAVEAGKRARTETAIQRGTTSLAHAAVELAAEVAGGLRGKRVVVVGAGEMGLGMATALASRDDRPGECVVVNRTSERASELAALLGGHMRPLEDLRPTLAEADVVLSSTGAEEAVMGVEMFENALRTRSAAGSATGDLRGDLVVVDLAIPRDVDPAVGGLEGVVHLDVEDVRRHAEAQMEGRRSEVAAVRAILAAELERYRASAAGRLAAPVVAALRERAEQLRAAEIERNRARLERLGPEALELVEGVTRRIVAKLLHDPTVQLKEAAGSSRGERLAEALRALFDL